MDGDYVQHLYISSQIHHFHLPFSSSCTHSLHQQVSQTSLHPPILNCPPEHLSIHQKSLCLHQPPIHIPSPPLLNSFSPQPKSTDSIPQLHLQFFHRAPPRTLPHSFSPPPTINPFLLIPQSTNSSPTLSSIHPPLLHLHILTYIPSSTPYSSSTTPNNTTLSYYYFIHLYTTKLTLSPNTPCSTPTHNLFSHLHYSISSSIYTHSLPILHPSTLTLPILPQHYISCTPT